MTTHRMIVDLDRCIGCHSCTAACIQENEIDLGRFYTKVINVGPTGTYPNVEEYYLPVKCQHCETPTCVKVCPTGASYRREDGIVLVDHNKCIGCEYCIMACPYGVRSRNDRLGVIEKCTLCAHLVDDGKNPACVDICPGHARIFGDADDPASEVAQKLASTGDSLHRLADVGNTPGEAFLLANQTWRS